MHHIKIVLLSILWTQICFAANEDVKSAINSAKSKISSAQSFINSASTRIDILNTETNKLNAEKASFDNQKSISDAAKARMDAQNEQVLDHLSQVLSPQLYALEQDIKEEDYYASNLLSLKSMLENLTHDINYNQSNLNHLKSDFAEISSLYQGWLEDFQIFVNDNQPDFDSIIDRKTYNAAISYLANIFLYLPSTSLLLSKESTMKQNISAYLSSTDLLINHVRDFASVAPLATFKKFSGNASDEERLISLDAALRSGYGEASRLNDAIIKIKQQREIIIFNIIRIWYAYATLKLHLVNIEFGIEIILEVDRILGSPEIYAEVYSKTAFYSQQMEELVGSIYPFIAHKSTMDSEKFYSLLLEQLEKLNLAESFKAQIQALMADFKTQRDLYFEVAESMILDSETYMNEWKSITRRRLIRLGDTATPECLDLGSQIQNATESNIETEALFIQFRSEC